MVEIEKVLAQFVLHEDEDDADAVEVFADAKTTTRLVLMSFNPGGR